MDKKALSLPILISLAVGNMIGTGIYVLPASLAEYGTISLLAWVATSTGAVFLAFTFTSLNRRFNKTGGLYVYCKEAFGPLTGFIVAYVYWMSYLVSIAGVSVASIGYLGYIVPTFDANTAQYSGILTLLAELVIVWFFTGVNLIGVHTAGVTQLILTTIKLIPLFVITIIGFASVKLSNILPFTHGTAPTDFSALSMAAALTFWGYIGIDAAMIPAENAKSSRDIYRATIIAVLLTATVYICSTFVLMGIIPQDQLKSTQFPFAQVGTMLFGSGAALLIVICAVISGLGTLNVCTLVQGQIVFAAARDHLFPRIFAKLSKRDVPIAGQLLSSGVVTLLLTATIEPTLLKQFNNIALLASLLTLAIYLVATLAEIKFILKSRRSLIHLFVSKSMFITIIAGAFTFWMIGNMGIKIICWGAIIVLVCIPIYFFTVRKYARA